MVSSFEITDLKHYDTVNLNSFGKVDMISIWMLKICGKSICRPLELIFNEYMSNGVFPSEWKKGNVVAIHKKPSCLVTTNLWQNPGTFDN